MIPRPFGGHHLVVYLDSDSHDLEVLILEWFLDLHNSKVNAECVGTTRFILGLQIAFMGQDWFAVSLLGQMNFQSQRSFLEAPAQCSIDIVTPPQQYCIAGPAPCLTVSRATSVVGRISSI